MENLRKTLLYRTCIPLTKSENQSKSSSLYNIENITWTQRSRSSTTHPHYPGPFTKENVQYYHIHCSHDMWIALEQIPEHHWDYRGLSSIFDLPLSYNPSNNLTSVCYMTLPIYQRKFIWILMDKDTEIFNNLAPRYQWVFDKTILMQMACKNNQYIYPEMLSYLEYMYTFS